MFQRFQEWIQGRFLAEASNARTSARRVPRALKSDREKHSDRARTQRYLDRLGEEIQKESQDWIFALEDHGRLVSELEELHAQLKNIPLDGDQMSDETRTACLAVRRGGEELEKGLMVTREVVSNRTLMVPPETEVKVVSKAISTDAGIKIIPGPPGGLVKVIWSQERVFCLGGFSEKQYEFNGRRALLIARENGMRGLVDAYVLRQANPDCVLWRIKPRPRGES